MEDSTFSPLHPKVVLGIAAHPDDLDFGAAGTLAKFARDGAKVHYLLLTDGSKGTSDQDISPSELIKIRQDEQRAAVTIIGGAGVEFLSYGDGELEVTMELKREIVKAIRTVKPDVVITIDPTVVYSAKRGMINHPDHRAAGQATLDAVFPLARDHLSFPELFAVGYEPHKTKTVLLINFNESNHTVDITETVEMKMQALAAHSSQFADLERTSTLMRTIASEAGENAGYTYGESFVRIDIPSS